MNGVNTARQPTLDDDPAKQAADRIRTEVALNYEREALDALIRGQDEIDAGLVPISLTHAVTFAALHLARTLRAK